MGKNIGGCGGWSFEGDWGTKGCYGYTKDELASREDYSSCMYYGTIEGKELSKPSQLDTVDKIQFRPYDYPICPNNTCDYS